MLTPQKFYSIKTIMLLFIATSLFFTSCKKDPSGGTGTPSPAAYKVEVDIRDSAYIYTKDIYLWTEVLPAITTFRPRDSKDVNEVMTKVRTFQPLDRFSFAEKKSETAQGNQGLDTDFGFLVKFYSGQTDLRINYVYQTSPGGARGVKRGWKILKINGRAIDGSKQADIDFLNDIFFGSPQTADFEFQKLDGTVTTLSIPKGIYALNTVLYRNVYTNGANKIGYLVFNQFSGNSSVNEIKNAMSYFQSNGVNQMIVDLRYNRGGFVSTQDTLANMLAPQSVGRGQKVMYTYVFNQRYSKWNETTYFNKTGFLNLNKIVFIVTPSSASASELLINNLRPVMTVKLVGEKKTYGKPVGFFPIPVFDYNIYPVSFKTVNSEGSADYYQGFNVDKNTVDDLSREFGDPEEGSLKEALTYINTGGFSAFSPKKIMSTGSVSEFQLDGINSILNERVPKIEIENRLHKMPKPIRDLQRKQ